VIGMFHYLRFGLSAVLAFVGVKMILSDVYHIPTGISLGVIALILIVAVIASVLKPLKTEKAVLEPEEEIAEK